MNRERKCQQTHYNVCYRSNLADFNFVPVTHDTPIFCMGNTGCRRACIGDCVMSQTSDALAHRSTHSTLGSTGQNSQGRYLYRRSNVRVSRDGRATVAERHCGIVWMTPFLVCVHVNSPTTLLPSRFYLIRGLITD